jgi:hypothetical protein
MLISTWLTAVRNRLQTPRVQKRRPVQKHASPASEHLEARTLLTTTLQAVRPNVGEFLVPGEIRTVAPQELTLQFSLGSTIDASSITTQSIQVFRSNFDGVFDDGDDVPVTIGYVGLAGAQNEVVLRFGEGLEDDHYRIVVTGTASGGLTATVPGPGGPVADTVEDSTFDFELDLGARIIAVDPQPVTVNANGTVSQARNQIVLYLNEDDLDPVSATNPAFYQLIFTNDTVSNLDDVSHLPSAVNYDSNLNRVTLTFAGDLNALAGAGEGTFRLRVGNSDPIPSVPAPVTPGVDPGDSFGTAHNLGPFIGGTNTSQIISSSIDPQPYQFAFPGANTDPGNRQIEVESHLLGGADGVNGTSQISYNFRNVYGTDPLGNILQNTITEAQKQRAREVFEFYGSILGIDFRETDAAGLTIVTGDMRALDPTIPTGPGGAIGLAGGGIAIMDQAEIWNDTPGGSWFETAMHEIGHLLGLGHTYELPNLTVMGSNGAATVGNVEPDFPGNHDIVHGQHLHRPDSVDIDLYQFSVAPGVTGTFTAEVIAERLQNSSRLDSVVRLFRQNADGSRELISQNDDYFSEDSFLRMSLEGGAAGTTYFIGISSVGNDDYDPTISGTGFGGTSQGSYELRVDFRPDETTTIVDTTGVKLDGDTDGQAGGVYNFWFRAATSSNTLFVSKTAMSTLSTGLSSSGAATSVVVQSTDPFAVGNVIRIDNEQMLINAINPTTRTLTVTRGHNLTAVTSHSVGAVVRLAGANGSANAPFGRISDAISSALPGQIIRVVGNGGADGDITTINDNRPYQIGFDLFNQPLQDGSTLEVPRGVTLMIDGGAVFKMRQSQIGTGSSSTSVNRSKGALQVLGTPERKVTFTSWLDESIGTDTTPTPTAPDAGDWGGLSFRATIDKTQAQGMYEDDGIFLNYVAQSDMRYGGGVVSVDGVNQTINPIFIDGIQPTIAYNTITLSDDSAMSANPDSFEEMTFHAPRFQQGAASFTSDYDRSGPDIYRNRLLNNSTNGLFVRVLTPAGNLTQKLTVPGRFDDTDIVHVIAQNLEIQGTPGGAVLDQTPPSVNLVTINAVPGGTLAAGTYNYRMVLTDEYGLEGPASTVTVSGVLGITGSLNLQQLPTATGAYTGRRLYRSAAGGVGPYTLVAELDKSSTSFLDNGGSLGRTLNALATRDRARTDARLLIDPGIVIKLEGARIEAEIGAQVIAEGRPGQPIIFTSRLDDRFGAGGTFDTNNDDNAPTEATPSAGNWGGIYIGHMGSASIDQALITFAGGVIPLEGNFAGFNALEIHQATARVRNTIFEQNANGSGGTAGATRSGLFSNAPGTIFVRGSQPVILDNQFRGNIGASININANSLDGSLVTDFGRATGPIDLQLDYRDNQGPLVRDNRFGSNTLNGMQVRGETLTTQGVWDDTDITHLLFDEVYIPDFHHYGGLRLESSRAESLVIKLAGASAGFTANGYPLDITDRIGGSLQIIGQPGQPVIMTSLADDSAGAGFDLTGAPLRDTDNNGNTDPSATRWRGVRILQYAHDRNVGVYVENEAPDRLSADTNSTIGTAENIGLLAKDQKSGDENLRLGFEVHGFVDSTNDSDIFSFKGVAGSTVWIDIDRTSSSLDTVIELLDANGNVIAYSDNTGTNQAVIVQPGTIAAPMPFSQFDGRDLYTLNQHDAGFRVILPGTAGVSQPYYVRVRSRAAGADPQAIGGLTTGVYQLQMRLQEIDEVPGSTVQYADIRYAVTGVDIQGQPAHSPIVGESAEFDSATGVSSVTIGNLMNSDRGALYMAGRLEAPIGGSRATATYDVDFWEFEVRYDAIQTGVFGPTATPPHVPVTIDLDFADGFARADVTVAVYDSQNRLILIGRDSNISDDQPKGLDGADVDDLSRGTNGKLDPFIGPVELIGGTYRLAVFPNDVVPEAMNQYWEANPTRSLVRLEPINSVQRIAEERFGNFDTPSAALGPVVDLFEFTGSDIDAKHIVPFHLGDVTLFVSQARGITGTNRSVVSSVDAFTGAHETLLGQFSPPTGDIAMRGDGQLHTFSTGPATGAFTDGNVGNYLQIDTGTAAVTNMGDDGITPMLLNGTAAAAHDVGIQFNAMAYSGTNGNNLWAVGNRSQLGLKAGQQGFVAAQYNTNIIYNFNTATGDQVNRNNGNNRVDAAQATQGAGTTQTEYGQIDTTLGIGGTGNIRGLAILNGATPFYAVDDQGNLYTYNPFSDTTSWVTQISHPISGQPVQFAGLTFGPDEVENGRYANMLFGISQSGELYAFNTAGVLQRIFNGAQSFVQISSVFNVTGLAFGTLDRNLWHTTSNRGGSTAADDGHGIDVAPFDNSIALPEYGQNSLYFGNERAGTTAGNKNTDGSNNPDGTRIRDINFPGGAHGTVVSNEFSLEGYASSDKPVLYFNYFLETEGAISDPNANAPLLMRDSFRVFVGDDSGEWNLVTTNNTFQSSVQTDEYDYGPDGGFTLAPVLQTFVDVVEAFDNTGGWRQARVDLSNFAGRSGLKLRFDFSTAGSMNVGNLQTTGSELYAVAASEITDSQTFTVGGRTFEFDLGSHLTLPSGGSIEGQTVTVFGTTYQFTATPVAATDILALPNEDSAVLAQRAAAHINAFINGTTINVPAGNVLQRESFTISGTTFTFTNNPLLPNDILATGAGAETPAVMAGRAVLAINSVLGANTAFVSLNGTSIELPGISSVTFGSTLNLSTANALANEAFTVLGNTFVFTSTPTLPTDIQADPGDSAAVLATRTAAVINSVIGVGTAFVDPGAPNRVSIPDVPTAGDSIVSGGTLTIPAGPITATTLEGENFTITASGQTFTFTATPTLPTDILAQAGELGSDIAPRIAGVVNAVLGANSALYDAGAANRVTFPTLAGSTKLRGGTLTTTSGLGLEGHQFQLKGVTFTYTATPVLSGQILARPLDSAGAIAARTATEINNILGGGTAFVSNNRVFIPNLSVAGEGFNLLTPGTPLVADTVGTPLVIDNNSTALAFDSANTPLTTGAYVAAEVSENRITFRRSPSINLPIGSRLATSGAFGTDVANQIVPLSTNMTANQVALTIRQALADVFANGDISIIKGHENLVQVIGQSVSDPGILPFTNLLPGDSFGAFFTGFQNGVGNRPGSLRGMNNAVEGVYIDDIIIGFAERGEMVTNAPATTGVIPNDDLYNPQRPVGFNYLGIERGAYDVELRRASDFGVSQSPNPTNILYRTIDTNDREASGVAITVPRADQLLHNATFVVSDGWRSVTFQFIDQTAGLGSLVQGNVPVIFDPLTATTGHNLDNQELVASLILTAINSQSAQNSLQTQAMYSGTTGSAFSRTIHLTGNGTLTPDASLAGVFTITPYNTYGDRNRDRDQGQILVQSSQISHSQNFGVVVDAGVRNGLSPVPHPGAVKNTGVDNTARLATGVVLMNNIVARNAAGGIRFSGDTGTNPLAAVPYGRIVNNTIVGIGTGVGIQVDENAAPTLLNNIVVDFTTGISVDGSSQTAGTTIGTTLYQGNLTNTSGGIGLGTFPIVLGANDPLFVNKAGGNYYPAPFAQSIDSSVNSLGDRNAIMTVKNPLGLGVSPVLAPELDVFGQKRGDDSAVSTPAGQGANVFIDRGAVDRVDFSQPRALLVAPEDQSSADGNPLVDQVWIDQSQILRQFRIRLIDSGIGVDGSTVSGDHFQILLDGSATPLEEGVDYTFVYDVITREAIFTAATFFADEDTEVRYIITVDNDGTSVDDTVDGIRDLAGNYLLANRADGTTRFDIVLTDGVNDPPEITAPATVSTNEDTDLVFSVAGGNGITIDDQDAHLGSNIITVTLTATNGTMSLSGVNGLTFSGADATPGVLDGVITITGLLPDIETALDGLTFHPDQDYFGPASIQIDTDDNGEFSGPSATDSATIVIDVVAVNDRPFFNPVSDPAAVTEDLADLGVTIPGFMTGQVAGPANETPPQTISATVVVDSVLTGNWDTSNFFAVAPAIDTTTGDLTFATGPDVNGTVRLQVYLTDSEGLQSIVQTFEITITAVNDEPVYVPNINLSNPLVSDEDAGLVTFDLIDTFAAGPATALDEVNTQTTEWILGTPSIMTGNLVFDSIQISADGTLTYETAADTAGTATVTLSLRDNGPGIPPDDNETASITLTIQVNQINDPPVAISGNYVLDEGYTLTLDASASYDVDEFFGDTLTYSWDLNNDGIYETNAGSQPTFQVTWAYLTNLGITAPATHVIRLQVTDSSNASDVDIVTLTTLIVDYGDAAATYGTLQNVGGAAHTIVPGFYLGSSVDKEITGQPTADATGDGSDEDGLASPPVLEQTAGQALKAYADVVASASGMLDAWIDFNQNGIFDHPSERLSDPSNPGVGYSLVAGVNRIVFEVPSTAVIGETILRLRFSSAGSLLPTGRASDGEVEDHLVKIRDLQAPVAPVIIKPIDITPANGVVPQTSDLTPLVEWAYHDANYDYDIEVRNSSNSLVFSQTGMLSTSVSITPVSGTLPAGRYTVTLIARNRAGTPASASTYTFDVVPLVVAQPIGDVGTSRPTITWNEVKESKQYQIEVLSQSSGSPVYSHTVNVDSTANPTSHVMTQDLGLGQYQVRVRAIDRADLPGDWSPLKNFTVRTSPVVTAPVGTVMIARPPIVWTAVPGASSYIVTLSFVTDIGVPNQQATVAGTTWTPTTDLRLGQYNVTVQAFSGAGATGNSSFVSTPHSFVVQPVPVATQPTRRLPDTTPTFSWLPVAGADFYELSVYQKWGSFSRVIHQTNLTGTTFTQPTALPLGRYTYRVTAINDASNLAASDVASQLSAVYEFVVTAPPVVTQPSTTTFDTHPTIKWTSPANSETSDIWVRQIGGANEFLRVNGVAGNEYKATGTTFGIGTYIVWVRTYSNTDNPATTADEREVTEWSIGKQFQVTTPPNVIGPVGRTSAARPTLTWQSVPGAVTYEIWIDNQSANVPKLYNVAGLNTLSYTVPANLPIGRYSFWVRAANAQGFNSAWQYAKQFEVVTPPTLTGPSQSTFNTRPTFNWTNMRTTLNGKVAGADTYEFRLQGISAATGKYVDLPAFTVTGLTGTTHTIPTNLPSGFYRAYVRGIENGLPASGIPATVSDFSFPLEFFVGGRPIVNAVGTTTDTTPTFSWKAVDGASSYEIFITTAAAPSTALLRQAGLGSTSFTMPSALSKGNYRVWVRAINATTGVASQWSDGASTFFTIASAEGTETDRTATFTLTAMAELEPLSAGNSGVVTISMIPVPDTTFTLVTENTAEVPLADVVADTELVAVPTEMKSVVDEGESETDEILSAWGDAAWWERIPESPVSQPESKQASVSMASALIGAVFALTPRALRRRDGDEQSK